MLERLLTLQSKREQYPDGGALLTAVKTDAALRAEIEALAEHFLGRKVSGCSNCYMDAYIELIHLSKQQIMAKENTHFHLKAGVLLHDVVNYEVKKNMTNANLTDELALYHLRTNPSCRELFDKLPDNIDELLAEPTTKTRKVAKRK